MDRVSPGHVRDAIVNFLSHSDDSVSLKEIEAVVVRKLGDIPRSSIRSYLNLNTPATFERTERGSYRLVGTSAALSAAFPWTEHMLRVRRASFTPMPPIGYAHASLGRSMPS
jgi:hypothetical protein